MNGSICGICGRECNAPDGYICEECGAFVCVECRKKTGAVCPACYGRLNRPS